MHMLAHAQTPLPAFDPIEQNFSSLDQTEREWLKAILRPLAWVDGLVSAALIAPSGAEARDDEAPVWIECIWCEGGAAAFEKLKPAQQRRIVSVVNGQCARIADMLACGPEAYRPYLSGFADPLEAAAQWAEGFRVGMRLDIDAWKPLLKDKDAASLVTAIFGLMPDESLPDDMWHTWPFRHLSADELMRFRRHAVEMLPQIVLSLRDGVREIDEANADRAEPYVQHARKAGRNEPCPCGSGMKFKRCCLD